MRRLVLTLPRAFRVVRSSPSCFLSQALVSATTATIAVTLLAQGTRAALPSGWIDEDIGSPQQAGSASYIGGSWTVAGGGSDIWNTADQFHLDSETVSGDGTIIAKVLTLQNTDPGSGWSKAGLMFRSDSSPGAVNVAIVATAGNGVSFQWRNTAGGGCNFANTTGLVVPVWLKLVRAGSNFSGYQSANGQSWTQVGTTQAVTITSNMLAGLAVTAHNNAALNTSTFTNVSLSYVPPVISLAELTNVPAANVQSTTATLGGQVLSTGNEDPSITLYYGTSDGGTNPLAWAYDIFLGAQSGTFAATVTGLATNTVYYFAAMGTNSAGSVWASPSQNFLTLSSAQTAVPILTYHYDNSRAGANTSETALTPANVNPNNFGKLFSYNVDGYVYAQALVATNVSIPGKGAHNVLYVATEHDTVYAFDADNYVPTPYWKTSFINPAAGVIPVPGGDAQGNIVPEAGITATPVIDPATGTIYVEARTKETSGATVSYPHRLHALDLSTGFERTNFNSPVVITSTNYPGTGTPGSNDTDGAGHVLWNGLREHCRPALLLANGMVYLAYASPGDHPPYYGWVFAYDAHTLAQTAVFNVTPNAGYGGIWMTGNGPAADNTGFVYLNTGNGNYDTNNDYGDSYLKLNGTNGLQLADSFTPYNQASLNSGDIDVSSAGLLLLPDSAGSPAHPHLLLGGSKANTIYLLDRDQMGGFNSSSDSQIVQSLRNAVGGMWSSPAYFNGLFYIIGNGDALKSFSIAGATMGTTPTARGPTSYGYPGATPTISANGTNNAIVWAIESAAFGSSGPAVLHAYDATNVAQELYNSSQNLGRDNPGPAVEFTLPAVANGKVYVGAQYAMSVYGNGSFLPLPTLLPNGGVFAGSVTVTMADAIPGTALFYTTDGTVPTTNALRYTGPVTLTNSTGVHVLAVKPGYIDSAVAVAGFINSASLGTGTGLSGAYYANQIGTFNNPPTLTRLDPTINFNWNSIGPNSSVGQTNFSVRWTGSVQPLFNEAYTFYATADDGVRVWLNGQLLINGWVDQPPTTYQAIVTLRAQQLYTVQIDYYQHLGGAVAQLAWSSPSTVQTIIPQSQLYPYTNPPPVVVLVSPATNASFSGTASVTLNAVAAAQYNTIDNVAFFANSLSLGSLSNSPYTLTATGLAPGGYTLTAVATDGSGLMTTSPAVNITANAGSRLPYGLSSRVPVTAFLNMPPTANGALPALLSQTGVFADAPSRVPASGMLPYSPNVALWSDGAASSRWMALPFNGGLDTPDQQIGFATNGEWSFPGGTIFVQDLALATDETNSNAPPRRLETRLLVRDPNSAVYGVTYKWRPDNSDADLLSNSLSEDIVITNLTGIRTQTWYYPGPSDCLVCHTPVANYVLGLKTRQLNGAFTYPSTGKTDNQLRVFNRLGLLNPAIDEAGIPGFAQLAQLTNQSESLTNRVRSYLDANCAQCHRPGGTGPSFDARYDTPLASQNIISGAVLDNLGYDNARVVAPRDIWRSILYQRANSTDNLIQMPPLARNVIDTNAMAAIAAFINGLPGTPALAPPLLAPVGGTFTGSVKITALPPDTNAAIYYTLDGSLPTTNSLVYSGPIILTNSATVSANAFEAGFHNSVAASGVFTILPPLFFTSPGTFSNGAFQVQLSVTPNQTYILQGSTDLRTWVSLVTNTPPATPFYLADPGAAKFTYRFYRVMLAP
jgi:hypothetical protein